MSLDSLLTLVKRRATSAQLIERGVYVSTVLSDCAALCTPKQTALRERLLDSSQLMLKLCNALDEEITTPRPMGPAPEIKEPPPGYVVTVSLCGCRSWHSAIGTGESLCEIHARDVRAERAKKHP
jgi:hypothetical protein